jgi:hypothetical protein
VDALAHRDHTKDGDLTMIIRMVVGLVLTVAAFVVPGQWLRRLAMSGQPGAGAP